MKTKNITINFKTLVDYLQGKLSQEEEKAINFLLLSDEKKYWEFIGLRGLKEANLLENYLETNLESNFTEESNIDFPKNSITHKKLIDYLQNKLSLEEKEEVKNQISKDEQLNFEFIKLNALFEEEELDNYLASKNNFVDSILNLIETQFENESENQSYDYENKMAQAAQTVKTISLKRYLSFAASFVLLMIFSFLIYKYVQEKQENKRLALENKLENKQKENTENSSSTNEYQTLGTNEKESIKLEDKLIRRTEDALDIVTANLSILAKMKKEDKAQNSKLHLDMVREYLSSQNSETKISISFLDKNDKMTNTIEFSDSETFFEWIEKQEKMKSLYLKDYTAILLEKNEKQTDKIFVKNGEIEDLGFFKTSSPTADFMVRFTNLVLEIK